ncbi:hypothetical protein HS088_TW12G00278 [Tripterygium wilfordii]|uniref:Uncharacterized protein n=1 Tax=Tripterygium wilfordii TaxID=458696 RepID=A0A7J7CYD9_TRIWF|nr:hypothetical protein HS088_TW12G00278 [Tripterygium wilfordii]
MTRQALKVLGSRMEIRFNLLDICPSTVCLLEENPKTIVVLANEIRPMHTSTHSSHIHLVTMLHIQATIRLSIICLLRNENDSFGYRLSRESNAYEESGQTNSDDTNEDDNQEQFKHSSYEDQEEIPLPEFKLANFLRGWLSYSRLWGTSKKVSEGRNPPSRFARHFLGGTPRMIRL